MITLHARNKRFKCGPIWVYKHDLDVDFKEWYDHVVASGAGLCASISPQPIPRNINHAPKDGPLNNFYIKSQDCKAISHSLLTLGFLITEPLGSANDSMLPHLYKLPLKIDTLEILTEYFQKCGGCYVRYF